MNSTVSLQVEILPSFLDFIVPDVSYMFQIVTDSCSIEPYGSYQDKYNSTSRTSSGSGVLTSIGCLYLALSDSSREKSSLISRLIPSSNSDCKQPELNIWNSVQSDKCQTSRKRHNVLSSQRHFMPKKNSGQVPRNFASCQNSAKQITSSIENSFAECVLNGERVFLCAFCSYRCKHPSGVKRHISFMHDANAREYICLTCDWKSKEKYKLKLHYVKVHNLPEVAAKSAADAA